MIGVGALAGLAIVALVVLAWPGHSSETAAATLAIAPLTAAPHDGETVRLRITGVGQSGGSRPPNANTPRSIRRRAYRASRRATPDDVDTCADVSQRTSVPPSDQLPVTASIEIRGG